MAEERVQKLIARAGLASRREAEDLIRSGEVTVNGEVAELGTKADAVRDHIKVRGKLLRPPEEKRYVLLNKPQGYVTTMSDPEERPTVVDLVGPLRERLFPVGRLDFNSEGLLLLTNDGELADRLTHPRYGCSKLYRVKVQGSPDEATLEKLRRGIRLEDGTKTRPCRIERVRRGRTADSSNAWLEVTLTEGKQQQIRRMFDLVGHRVMRLRRIAIGGLRDPKLPRGQWRDLSPDEVALLTTEPKKPVPRDPGGRGKSGKRGPGRGKAVSAGPKRKASSGGRSKGRDSKAKSRSPRAGSGKPAGRSAGTKGARKPRGRK
ncbi:MAG: rRNA pseudouridine synthase [Acidobacteria bacterium]|nr:rRNA pseudouridine synthase [Acidobacteriota bacterium]